MKMCEVSGALGFVMTLNARAVHTQAANHNNTHTDTNTEKPRPHTHTPALENIFFGIRLLLFFSPFLLFPVCPLLLQPPGGGGEALWYTCPFFSFSASLFAFQFTRWRRSRSRACLYVALLESGIRGGRNIVCVRSISLSPISSCCCCDCENDYLIMTVGTPCFSLSLFLSRGG